MHSSYVLNDDTHDDHSIVDMGGVDEYGVDYPGRGDSSHPYG